MGVLLFFRWVYPKNLLGFWVFTRVPETSVGHLCRNVTVLDDGLILSVCIAVLESRHFFSDRDICEDTDVKTRHKPRHLGSGWDWRRVNTVCIVVLMTSVLLLLLLHCTYDDDDDEMGHECVCRVSVMASEWAMSATCSNKPIRLRKCSPHFTPWLGLG